MSASGRASLASKSQAQSTRGMDGAHALAAKPTKAKRPAAVARIMDAKL
jgi:hypothetical protein